MNSNNDLRNRYPGELYPYYYMVYGDSYTFEGIMGELRKSEIVGVGMAPWNDDIALKIEKLPKDKRVIAEHELEKACRVYNKFLDDMNKAHRYGAVSCDFYGDCFETIMADIQKAIITGVGISPENTDIIIRVNSLYDEAEAVAYEELVKAQEVWRKNNGYIEENSKQLTKRK